MLTSKICALIATAPFAGAALAADPATLQVDASDAPMHILHVAESLPAKSGPLNLYYAKWIPGEHMPTGPIANLVDLHVFAGSAEVAWRRDLVDMNSFHLDVPPGVSNLTINFDYVAPTSSGSFGAAPSTDANLAVVNWYEVGLWPQEVIPDQIKVRASLKTPAGWKNGGSLDVESTTGNVVQYATTSVADLNDHPVVIGAHYRHIDLFPANSDVGEHAIELIGDSDWSIQVPDKRIDNYKRLVREERTVFGGVGHYRKYHWLLTVSEGLGGFGVEHHECADDRAQENFMVDDDASRLGAILLPHEFFHSWNGKTMRPAGLVNGGYEKPMKGDGLWVYEGMTNYYGEVLATRCGLMKPSDYAEVIAADYLSVNTPGRNWRSVQDTADSAPYLYLAPNEWSGIRRSTDFYAEGSLIWLETDAKIRDLTKGAKSLDDFCALFEGGSSNGKIYTKAYATNEVYEALNKVAPNDWKQFLEARLNAKGQAPDGGITAAGYRLAYSDVPNDFVSQGRLNTVPSLGLSISSDGSVGDSWPGSPGYKAGISVGTKVIAVDGRQYSDDEMKRAIVTRETVKTPIQLIIKSGSFYSVVQLDYHDGLRYPHLERIPGAPDVIAQITAPRAKL